MMMDLTAWNVLLVCLVVYTISRVFKLYDGIRATGHLPGFRIPFQAYGLPGALFKTSWWNLGLEGVWHKRDYMYKQFGSDTIAVTPFIAGMNAIFTSNADVAKQIHAGFGPGKSVFDKVHTDERGPMGYWGPSVLIAENDVWKRHRRIVGPAFSQNLYELVWSESLDLYRQMIAVENRTNASTFPVPKVQELTFKFALYVVGRCGFDFPFRWCEGKEADGGVDNGKGFADAMRVFIDYVNLLQLPDGVRKLPFPIFKQLDESIDLIRKFMVSRIAEKEAQASCEKNSLGDDIFSMLVQANQGETESRLRLDYQELISNVFLMLFAGHETTAHVLAATVACLARYQDQQQEILEQIMDVVSEREPTIEDYPKLNKVKAAFHEALRLYPTAYVNIREAKDDTFIHVPVSLDSNETKPVFVRKGTATVVDMIGLHRNPRYFDKPDEYRISRWNNISEENEVMHAFGIGPRACIGRKFALTEAVCFLTMLLRDYKIEPLLSKGETVDEWFSRVGQCSAVITLGVKDVAVKLVKRQ